MRSLTLAGKPPSLTTSTQALTTLTHALTTLRQVSKRWVSDTLYVQPQSKKIKTGDSKKQVSNTQALQATKETKVKASRVRVIQVKLGKGKDGRKAEVKE